MVSAQKQAMVLSSLITQNQARAKEIKEYWRLTSLQNLSEVEEERMQEILNLALEEASFGEALHEIDTLLQNNPEYFNEQTYKNQQAKLREYLGLEIKTASTPKIKDYFNKSHQ